MPKPGLLQNSLRTTVSGRHSSGAGNGKGRDPGLTGTVPVSHYGNTVPGCYPEFLGCWWVHLSDEILTPWHLKTFHNVWDAGPSVWYPGYNKIWVVLFYFWRSCSFQCVKKNTHKILFFLDYKNNTYSLYRNWKRQTTTQKKIPPPDIIGFSFNVLPFL